jgi:septal ring-binding cell division protein DamX
MPAPADAAATPVAAGATAEAPTTDASAPTGADTAAAMPVNGTREFLALPGADFAIEVAHAGTKAQLDALRATIQPGHRALYEVRLQRDGADWWLLLWGNFDSLESAREARAQLPADARINAGWPRRIAPLQAEARSAGG